MAPLQDTPNISGGPSAPKATWIKIRILDIPIFAKKLPNYLNFTSYRINLDVSNPKYYLKNINFIFYKCFALLTVEKKIGAESNYIRFTKWSLL